MLKTLTRSRSLILIIGLALILRLLAAAALPNHLSDDSSWYLDSGERLMTNQITDANYLTIAPLYAMVAGSTQHIFGQLNRPSPAAIADLLLLQACFGAGTAAMAWRIARRLTNDDCVALIAGLGIAINPICILDDNLIWTEPLYLFLLAWGFAFYLAAYLDNPPMPGTHRFRAVIGTGILFGLATLTRAQSLLFPVGLAIHLLFVIPWKQALRKAAVLLLVYAAVVSLWTLYNFVKLDKLVFGASGAADFLLVGAVGYNGGANIDAQYAALNGGKVPSGGERNALAVSVVSGAITSNPLGYLTYRAKELAKTLLQPHMTTTYAGVSLKTMLAAWVRSDRSLSGLERLLSDPTFWPKLVLYIAHYLALILGGLGIVITRREWRKFAPLTGFIAYILLEHLFLLALPRYLYPITLALWIFAAITLVQVWERFRRVRKAPVLTTATA